MMFLSRSVIALSMMVVVAAVAPNSARAADAEAGASAPVPSEAAPAPADESATGKEPSEHTSKHRAKPAAVGAAAGEESPRFFGGPAQSSHKFQTGLSIMPGSGYRLIVPYKEAQFCADSSGQGTKRVCAHSVPIFLDFQLAFGVAARADAIVDVRFGLQSDPATGGNHQFALAPGLRFWLDQEVALKFYTTLQFVYDYTDFSNNPGVRSSDYGVRNANGLMYDPIRNVGFFVQFAETIGFARWFRIDLDIGLGAQIRFP